MPLVMTPLVLVALLLLTHISWQDYIAETTGCSGCWASDAGVCGAGL